MICQNCQDIIDHISKLNHECTVHPDDPAPERYVEVANEITGIICGEISWLCNRGHLSPAQLLGAKGGSKSRRTLTSEQSAAMCAARKAKKKPQ